ncbi:MAG: DUF885 family protein [Gemmatimonadota bacterium]
MARTHRLLALAALGVLGFAGPARAQGEAEENRAHEALHRLFHDDWEFTLRESPLFATDVGDARYNDRLPSETVGDYERRLEARRGFLRRLRAIDRTALDAADRVNYDIFGRLNSDGIAEMEFRTFLMPITNRSGFHISFPQLGDRVPLGSVADYENYIARLRAFRRWAGEYIGLMREGIREGLVLPRVVLEGWEGSVDPHIVEDPTESLLYAPFRRFPEAVAAGDRERLAAEGAAAIRESVVPGYRDFRDFMASEYVPAARETVGASDLPNGRAFYEHRVRRFTTLDVTPGAVHERGLREVARIRGEMDAIIRKVGFEGDFKAFVESLRTDPRFYVDTPRELLERTAYVLKRMDGQLPTLFKTLPRMPYGIKPIPDFIAPKTTTAYYDGPSGDGTRAGFYYVNTYDLPSRPTYEIEALSLHEAVPGHHLQIALQQELEGMPDFRRFSGFTAFVEGWALYAERLGLEAGFYEDPYSDFGRLTYEMWRALRLVVDTGMHALGWSRQRAIDYMAENSALSLHNITTEVDRYISWPGQALAYKTGELKIRELRALAESELGDRFDVREFHDVVLGSGAVPLDVLEDNVRAYIAGAADR